MKTNTQHRRRRMNFEELEPRRVFAGHDGPALALDGVNDYARAADSPSLDLGIGASIDATFEAFFYASDPTREANQLLIYKRDAYSIFFNENGLFAELRFNQFGGGLQLFSPGTLSEGWHHVAAVFDNELTSSQDLFALYCDGNLVASTMSFDTSSLNNSTAALALGANFGAVPFSGWIDEARFSNSVRYSGPSHTVSESPFSVDASTRALWHFDDTAGSTSFVDASGNGNTATGLNGAATGIPTAPPDPATNLTANATAANRVHLAWLDPATNETGFKIERSTDGATSSWSPPSAPTPPATTT